MHLREVGDHLRDVLEWPLARCRRGPADSGQQVLGGRAETAFPETEPL